MARSCSEHPGRELLRVFAGFDEQYVCREAGHGWWNRQRCGWCGQAIDVAGVLRRSYRALYCRPSHRLAAWRAEQRRLKRGDPDPAAPVP